jgi:hypothetical protein
MPGNNPLGLLDAWARNTAGLYAVATPGFFPGGSAAYAKLLIANQILAMLDSVYRREADDGYRFWPKGDVDGHWKAIETEFAKLDIRWNTEKQRYTFKDGSHLPDPVPTFYRRHIWKLEGVNGAATLTFERVDKKRVQVLLSCSGEDGNPTRQFNVKVFAVKDKSNPLVELKQDPMGTGSSYQRGGMKLAEGEEIQAQLTVGEREQLSPVYRP